jgi:hypothetical protein
MKLRMLMVVALWAIVGFVMWFGYGMVGAPTHFMAFLFVTCCIVGAMIPALWESIVLVQRLLNRERFNVYDCLHEFVNSDSDNMYVDVDEYTYFHVLWNHDTRMWDVALMGSDGGSWDWFTLDSASFFNRCDAAWWVESKHQEAGYEMSDYGSI